MGSRDGGSSLRPNRDRRLFVATVSSSTAATVGAPFLFAFVVLRLEIQEGRVAARTLLFANRPKRAVRRRERPVSQRSRPFRAAEHLFELRRQQLPSRERVVTVRWESVEVHKRRRSDERRRKCPTMARVVEKVAMKLHK